MIVQEFYIPDYDWEVRVYYAVDCYYTDRIIADLQRVGCRGLDLVNAYKNMRACNLNTGITYSNIRNRETVMVFALTSSPEEFQNSFDMKRGIYAGISHVHLASTRTGKRRSILVGMWGRRCSR